MKTSLTFAIAALLVLSLPGCLSRETKKKAAAETTTETEIVVTEHNARNSLDFEGTYKTDRMPGADGAMSVAITLSGDNFTRATGFAGKAGETLEESGQFTWNDAGNTITLDGAQVPNRYFVAEGRLIQLDIDGNRITGDMAHLYDIPQITAGGAQ